MRKKRLCYQQFENKGEGFNTWPNGENTKVTAGGRWLKLGYLKNFGWDHQLKFFYKVVVNQQTTSQVGSKVIDLNVRKGNGDNEKGVLKCWGSGEPHLPRDYPHNARLVQNIQAMHKTSTVNDMAMNIPRISATLEDRQVEHQSSIVELGGILVNQSISVLIDLRASLSYVGLQVVEICNLKKKKEKYKTTWLVQFATCTKRRVTIQVKECPLNLNEYMTMVDLNTLPLGSYDILIRMDWLE